MHVLNAAEVTVECCREDDDGNVWATAAKEGGNFGAELAGSEVIVKDGDIDIVEVVDGLFDSRGGQALIAMLTQDGGAEVEIGWLIVEQQNTHGLRVSARHSMNHASDAIGRLNHSYELI
jgi:hypothetical protein